MQQKNVFRVRPRAFCMQPVRRRRLTFIKLNYFLISFHNDLQLRFEYFDSIIARSTFFCVW